MQFAGGLIWPLCLVDTEQGSNVIGKWDSVSESKLYLNSHASHSRYARLTRFFTFSQVANHCQICLHTYFCLLVCEWTRLCVINKWHDNTCRSNDIYLPFPKFCLGNWKINKKDMGHTVDFFVYVTEVCQGNYP